MDLEIIRICNACGKSHDKLKRCARCNIVRYCSKECQSADWPEHKTKCVPGNHDHNRKVSLNIMLSNEILNRVLIDLTNTGHKITVIYLTSTLIYVVRHGKGDKLPYDIKYPEKETYYGTTVQSLERNGRYHTSWLSPYPEINQYCIFLIEYSPTRVTMHTDVSSYIFTVGKQRRTRCDSVAQLLSQVTIHNVDSIPSIYQLTSHIYAVLHYLQECASSINIHCAEMDIHFDDSEYVVFIINYTRGKGSHSYKITYPVAEGKYAINEQEIPPSVSLPTLSSGAKLLISEKTLFILTVYQGNTYLVTHDKTVLIESGITLVEN